VKRLLTYESPKNHQRITNESLKNHLRLTACKAHPDPPLGGREEKGRRGEEAEKEDGRAVPDSIGRNRRKGGRGNADWQSAQYKESNGGKNATGKNPR